MAFYDKFPYTNFQELNLDWLTQEVSKVRDNRDATDASAAAALASEKAAKASETAAAASQRAAANSETAAAGSEAASADYLAQIGTHTAGAVADWLKENLQPTTPPVDESLTISGAAADAKATGDRISDLTYTVDEIYKSGKVTAESKVTKYINMRFISGRRYTVKNISDGYTSCNTKNEALSSAAVIQSIGTIAPNSSLTFTASADAVYLSCYFGIAGTVTVIDADTVLSNAISDIEDNETSIENIRGDVTNLSNHITTVNDSFTHFKETGYDYFIQSHFSLFAVGYVYQSTGVYNPDVKYAVSTTEKFTADISMEGEYTVGDGYSIAVLYYTGDEFTSSTYSSGQTFKLETGKQYKLRITEEPIDTSVIFTSPNDVLLSIFAYAPILKNLMQKVYHVEKDGSGDFTKLVDAIKEATKYMNAVVYVGAGTWDIIDEFGETYMESVSSNPTTWGLELKNNVHVIGTAKTIIQAHYTGTTQNTREYFSAFNAGAYGFTLENVKIDADNIRYAIHDDRGSGGSTPYVNKFINCDMKLTNGYYGDTVIGGGLGINGTIEIRNCRFEGSAGTHRLAYYHGNNYRGETGAKCTIIVQGCYFAGNGSFDVTKYGDSTEMSTAYLSNNSFGSAPQVTSGSYAPQDNMQIVAWNNEVRS